jgi:Domain of unknown function (DUF6046)
MAEFNIKKLLIRAAYDYIGPSFPEWWAKNKSKFDLPDLRAINANQLKGGKYFMTLKLSYKGNHFELPNEPLIGLSLTKTIVETATVGKERKGTVKEYITTEDYAISIKGICIDKTNPEKYPADQVALLNDLLEINDALEVESNPFLELFGIRKIVLKDIQFDDMMGEAGVQKYTLTAVSDQDFYADLTEKDKEKSNLLA